MIILDSKQRGIQFNLKEQSSFDLFPLISFIMTDILSHEIYYCEELSLMYYWVLICLRLSTILKFSVLDVPLSNRHKMPLFQHGAIFLNKLRELL